MFDLNVRFLDGSCEKIVVPPNSYVTDIRRTLMERRGLDSRFYGLKLVQGTEELDDDGYIQVLMPIQGMARVRLNLVGSEASLADVLQPQEHWSGSRFYGIVLENVCPLSGADREQPTEVVMHAAVTMLFSNIVTALGQWPGDGDHDNGIVTALDYDTDSDDFPDRLEQDRRTAARELGEEAVAMLEGMATLDLEQAKAILRLVEHSGFLYGSAMATRFGRAIGSLCDDFPRLVPQLMNMLGNGHLTGNTDAELVAAMALSSRAESSPEEKWLLQHDVASGLRGFSSELMMERIYVQSAACNLIFPAITLLGATGTSKSIDELATYFQGRARGPASFLQDIMDAFTLAKKSCLAREKRPQVQAAPEPAASDGLAPNSSRRADSSSALVPQTSESEEELRDLDQALELDDQMLLQQEGADIVEAIIKSKSEASDKVNVMVRPLRIIRNARLDELVKFFEEAPELAPYRMVMQEAGCPLRPSWADGAWLFVPVIERADIVSDIVLNETYVLVCEKDADAIKEAVLSAFRIFPKDRRPKFSAEPASSASASFVPNDSEAAEVGSDELGVERTFLAYARRTPSSLDGRMAHSAP